MRVFLLPILMIAVSVFAQVKKPTLMVVPSHNWCKQNGFIIKDVVNGTLIDMPDLKSAIQNNINCYNAVSTINALMANRGFPLKDLLTLANHIEQREADDLIEMKDSAEMSFLDMVRLYAKSDIILELSWSVKKNGPKRSVECFLSAIDAYTCKQIAFCHGVGNPSFSIDTGVLLEEAIIGSMDNFVASLQEYFCNMEKNGREIVLCVKIEDMKPQLSVNSEMSGKILLDIIDNWISENVINDSYILSESSELYLKFEQVNIPLFQDDECSIDARMWARKLAKYLALDYGLQCKVKFKGLGEALLVIENSPNP